MTPQRRGWGDLGLAAATLPTLLLQLLIFVVPLGMTAALSFQSTQYYRVVWSWDLKIWAEVLSGGHYWLIISRTVGMALACVLLCIVISLPVAYAMVHRLQSWNNHIKILIVFAFLTDAVLKTFGWVLFLDRSGGLNWLLEQVGFSPQAVDILFTPSATLLGMVYNLVPYTIFTIYLSLARIDRDLVLAAYDAGSSRLRAFFEVTLPLARPGLYAGAVLVFVLSLGVFLEPKVMGGGTRPLAAELIRQSFETRVNWPLGAALTLVMIVIAAASLALFALTLRFYRRRVAA